MNGVEEKAELAVCSNILVYAGAATTGRFAPKKVYAIGSMSTSDGLQWTNWVYDPVECTLSIVKPMSVQRTAFRMVAVDDFFVCHRCNRRHTCKCAICTNWLSCSIIINPTFVAVLVISIGLTMTGLFFYFKKRLLCRVV